MKERLALALVSVSNRERGAAMAEYGFLIVLVALVVLLTLVAFGDTLSDTFGFAAETFNESPAVADGGDGGEATDG